MLYSIWKNNVGGTDVNISDYVLRISNVPYMSKNLDKSLVASGYSFTYSFNSPTALASGDRILFYREAQVIHIGIVEKSIFNEDNQTYNVQVNHILSELQKRNTANTRTASGGGGLGYVQFLEKMVTASNPITVGGISYTLLLAKDLIDLIIAETEVAALSLDWTNTALYDSTLNWIWKSVQAGDASLTEVNSPTSAISGIYFLPHQINCTGIGGIYLDTEFTNDLHSDRPSLFELLSVLCSMFGFSFIPKDATTFYVVSNRLSPAGHFADEDIYSVFSEDEIIESTGAQSSYSTLDYHLWFRDAYAYDAYDSGTAYFNGDYVTYSGNVYRATFGYYNATEPETGGIIGIDPTNTEYWYQVTEDIEMRYYVTVGQATSLQIFINYEYKVGIKPTYLSWLDNFNPIVVSTGDAYICIPSVSDAYTVIQNQKAAKTNSFTRVEMETKASTVLTGTLYEFTSIEISDINNDTVECEYYI
jgi:hypothetical protein